MNHKQTAALAAAVAAALGLAACQQQSTDTSTGISPEAAAETPVENTTAVVEAAPTSGIDTDAFSATTRAQDDFYEYVNGTWLAETEIPADKSNYGSLTKLADEAEENLRTLIGEVSRDNNAAVGSAAQKIRDFYNSYMDADAVDQAGVEAIREELDTINGLDSLESLYRLVGDFSKHGVDAPFGGGIFSDLKQPDVNVVYLSQAGLTLPDRDYYLEDTEQYVKGRDLYKQYVADIFECAGIEGGEAKANALLAFETALAEVQWTREDNRDPNKRYNPKSFQELAELAPAVNWQAMFDGAGLPLRDKYIVSQPSYFEAADDIVANTDLNLLKDYLTFQTIHNFAPLLSDEFFNLWFDFARKGLQGVPEPRPRWKRAVASVNNNLGELLGQLYVQKHFKPEAKARMVDMVNNLKSAYRESIKTLEWMGEDTKQAALTKLDGFYTKIGYPDQWRDYSSLRVQAGDLIGNIKASNEFENQRQLNKLDKPVDKTEWFMTPQIVNAYYNPAWNEIVFPAAILQPPFFNFAAEDAVNYGGIGAVIGHEIGHGFDDQGRKFDGDGNLRDWWTDEDNEKFLVLKDKLAKQYNGFEVIDGMTINGEFTSGENIGDLGGLSIAYKAYRMSLNGEEPPVIDGLTGDQRFFLGWAQVWARLYRDEELKRRLTVDPHSPSKARTNVVVSNIPTFYEAFDVKEGDGMYLAPEERVKIW